MVRQTFAKGKSDCYTGKLKKTKKRGGIKGEVEFRAFCTVSENIVFTNGSKNTGIKCCEITGKTFVYPWQIIRMVY